MLSRLVDIRPERFRQEADTQNTTVNFPLIADPDRKVADLYGMIHPNASDTVTVTAKYQVSTPADWKDGEDVIIVPAVPDDLAKEKFPKGFRSERPYLRWTPQPNR
jgi:thioredoxin-dependent peroxiredoxin